MLDDNLLNTIADQIDSGFNCYVHRETFNLISIPDLDHYRDIEIKAWKKEQTEIEKNFNHYFIIKPLESFESFRIMQEFIDTVNDHDLHKRLIIALNKRKPFRNFKQVIDYSGEYRDKWFKFKRDSLIDIIKDNLNFLSETELL